MREEDKKDVRHLRLGCAPSLPGIGSIIIGDRADLSPPEKG